MKRGFWDVVGTGVVYGAAVALATLIVSLAWTSLQRPGITSAAERVHREIAECSADYKAARTGRDSSRVLERMVKAPPVDGPNTITCRDLMLGQPRW
jgi:hypothetical protein